MAQLIRSLLVMGISFRGRRCDQIIYLVNNSSKSDMCHPLEDGVILSNWPKTLAN